MIITDIYVLLLMYSLYKIGYKMGATKHSRRYKRRKRIGVRVSRLSAFKSFFYNNRDSLSLVEVRKAIGRIILRVRKTPS